MRVPLWPIIDEWKEGRKESVPCPGQPELAYKGKSSAIVTGFVLAEKEVCHARDIAEGTHQKKCLFGEFHSIQYYISADYSGEGP